MCLFRQAVGLCGEGVEKVGVVPDVQLKIAVLKRDKRDLYLRDMPGACSRNAEQLSAAAIETKYRCRGAACHRSQKAAMPPAMAVNSRLLPCIVSE